MNKAHPLISYSFRTLTVVVNAVIYVVSYFYYLVQILSLFVPA